MERKQTEREKSSKHYGKADHTSTTQIMRYAHCQKQKYKRNRFLVPAHYVDSEKRGLFE